MQRITRDILRRKTEQTIAAIDVKHGSFPSMHTSTKLLASVSNVLTSRRFTRPPGRFTYRFTR